MPDAVFDKREQLQKVQESVLPGEIVEAVFDLKNVGSGFLGITNRRIVFFDPTFMRKMKAVVSVPYSRISTIAAQDEAGMFTGRGFFSSSKLMLTISGGADYEFEFRGADKAHIAHNLILSHMV